MMNYYEILGVNRDASRDDIRKAYKKLAIKYHPDKGSGNEKNFQEVSAAHEVLSNDDKRMVYNKALYTSNSEDQARQAVQRFEQAEILRQQKSADAEAPPTPQASPKTQTPPTPQAPPKAQTPPTHQAPPKAQTPPKSEHRHETRTATNESGQRTPFKERYSQALHKHQTQTPQSLFVADARQFNDQAKQLIEAMKQEIELSNVCCIMENQLDKMVSQFPMSSDSSFKEDAMGFIDAIAEVIKFVVNAIFDFSNASSDKQDQFSNLLRLESSLKKQSDNLCSPTLEESLPSRLHF